jgi:hypothetical protein
MTATVLAEEQVQPAEPSVVRPKSSLKRALQRHFRRHVAAWLALLGLVCTGGFALIVMHKPGVYFSEVKVVFQPPKSTLYPNPYTSSPSGLIVTAGLVDKLIDPNQSLLRMSSSTITIANEGVRNGSSVRLPDDGGQWADNFDQSLLDVQAVGPSATEVANAMRLWISRINTTLARVQEASGANSFNMITTYQSPPQLPIYYQTGSRIRALAGTLGLGFGLTLAAQYWARRYVRRRDQNGVRLAGR